MVQILASFDSHFIRVHGNGNGPEMVLSYFVGGWDTPPPNEKSGWCKAPRGQGRSR